jgi:carbonic anhydrase
MRSYPIIVLMLSVAGISAAQTSANWNYYGKTGPLGWGKLDPAYQACSKGHEQSPIDIRNARLDKSLPPIQFHYLAAPVTEENDGRTVIVHVEPGSYIVVDGTRYDLVNFAFKHPSEEAVKGKLTDMSVQLLHKSADGKMVMIAVRLSEDRGDSNAVMATLLEHLPTKAGQKEKVSDLVNPGGLLPADRGYWTFMGSLTTPPCTEGVRWFVFEQPVSISRFQLQSFAGWFPMNTRPLQDAHGRKILANE